MTPASPRVFLADLQALERELALPIPDRLRLLEELEFDLEQLRRRFLDDGCSEPEARVRALQALVPEGGALEELLDLHTPLYVRLTRGVGAARLRLLERSAFVVASAGVLLTEAYALLQADLLTDPSPFLWPVLALGALISAAVAMKMFELWVRADHRSPQRGLSAILALCGMTLGGAGAATVVELARLAAVLERGGDSIGPVVAWLVRDAVLLAVATLVALAGGLAWLVLNHWVVAVSADRRAVLGPSTIQAGERR